MSNVVINLGTSSPKTHLGKLQIVSMLEDFISFRKLNQDEAAAICQIDSEALETIRNGEVASHSHDSLMRLVIRVVS